MRVRSLVHNSLATDGLTASGNEAHHPLTRRPFRAVPVSSSRRFWLAATTALTPLMLCISAPALAADCTLPIVGNATCTGTFTNNITATDSNPLTLTDVTVNSPGGVAVGVASGVGAISIGANGVIINNAGSGGLSLTPDWQ